MERRLAAVLAADMVGYSRLMAKDEAGTIARQKRHRADLIDPKIAQYGGRIVKTTGDGLLVEFASVVDAVQCSLEIQAAMPKREADQSEDRRIRYRIGINLGDIVLDGEDILGDGVNVAARLEGLADPGGVMISDGVYQNIQGKLQVSFQDLGLLSLKNMERKVRAWKWVDAAVSDKNSLHSGPPLTQPEKPSLAVLPFDNLSNDPDQEFLADGIAEDVITELSKFKSLFVIARCSSFAFKGQALDAKEISHKLGVRYVVEGSVRRSGNRVRITAQLIDANEDKHIWAERYDRDLEDIFSLQDEVTVAVVSAIEPQLSFSERKRALRKPPESLDAWENYQRALWHALQYRGEDCETAIMFFRRAIELDPNFSSAHAGLAYTLYIYIILGASPDRQRDLKQALEEAQTAVRLDAQDPFAYVALTRGYLLQGDPEAAIAAADKCIDLTPNLALAHFGKAHALWHAGRPDEAVICHDHALRLSPHDPLSWAYLASKAIALVMLKRFEEAIAISLESQRHLDSRIFSHLAEMSALGHLGREKEAENAVARALMKKPDATIAYVAEALPITDETCRKIFHDGLRMAGLPAG